MMIYCVIKYYSRKLVSFPAQRVWVKKEDLKGRKFQGMKNYFSNETNEIDHLGQPVDFNPVPLMRLRSDMYDDEVHAGNWVDTSWSVDF